MCNHSLKFVFFKKEIILLGQHASWPFFLIDVECCSWVLIVSAVTGLLAYMCYRPLVCSFWGWFLLLTKYLVFSLVIFSRILEVFLLQPQGSHPFLLNPMIGVQRLIFPLTAERYSKDFKCLFCIVCLHNVKSFTCKDFCFYLLVVYSRIWEQRRRSSKLKRLSLRRGNRWLLVLCRFWTWLPYM